MRTRNHQALDNILSVLVTSAVTAAIVFVVIFSMDGARIREISSGAASSVAFATAICSLVQGCMSIQWLRFAMLCGRSRGESFVPTIVSNLAGSAVAAAVSAVISIPYTAASGTPWLTAECLMMAFSLNIVAGAAGQLFSLMAAAIQRGWVKFAAITAVAVAGGNVVANVVARLSEGVGRGFFTGYGFNIFALLACAMIAAALTIVSWAILCPGRCPLKSTSIS